MLERQFASMAAHVRRVESLLSPTGLWDTGFQFGDWLDPDAPPDDPAKAKADTGVVATACALPLADDPRRDRRAPRATPTTPPSSRSCADRTRAAFNEHYVADGRHRPHRLHHGLRAGDRLRSARRRDRGAAPATGSPSSPPRAATGSPPDSPARPFITDALTQTGHLDDAYQLLLERECPSWLYPVTMGATTIWERWDSMLPDGTINPGEMTSFNHYALGAVADWMHRTSAASRRSRPATPRSSSPRSPVAA